MAFNNNIPINRTYKLCFAFHLVKIYIILDGYIVYHFCLNLKILYKRGSFFVNDNRIGVVNVSGLASNAVDR